MEIEGRIVRRCRARARVLSRFRERFTLNRARFFAVTRDSLSLPQLALHFAHRSIKSRENRSNIPIVRLLVVVVHPSVRVLPRRLFRFLAVIVIVNTFVQKRARFSAATAERATIPRGRLSSRLEF